MRKRKILIIDDEPEFTEMVKLNLEAVGFYEVATENVGSYGLARALEFMPDLIFLDVIMPDKEGPEVLNEIKDNVTVRKIPVVFLTATIRREEVWEDAGTIGGRSFFAKPGSVGELIECIERHLHNVF